MERRAVEAGNCFIATVTLQVACCKSRKSNGIKPRFPFNNQHEISLMQQRGREKVDKQKEVDEQIERDIKDKNDQLVATRLLEQC